MYYYYTFSIVCIFVSLIKTINFNLKSKLRNESIIVPDNHNTWSELYLIPKQSRQWSVISIINYVF